MTVNMIFAVEWTTYAVEIEPVKIQAWSGIDPWPFTMTGRTVLSIKLIKPTGEQAIVSS